MISVLKVVTMYALSAALFVACWHGFSYNDGDPTLITTPEVLLIIVGLLSLVAGVGTFIYATGVATMMRMKNRTYIDKSLLRYRKRRRVLEILYLAVPGGGSKKDKYYEVLLSNQLIAELLDKPWEAPEAHREGYGAFVAKRNAASEARYW